MREFGPSIRLAFFRPKMGGFQPFLRAVVPIGMGAKPSRAKGGIGGGVDAPPLILDSAELAIPRRWGSPVKRAFMSKQEEKVNILIRFGIFYLCNGRSIIRQL